MGAAAPWCVQVVERVGDCVYRLWMGASDEESDGSTRPTSLTQAPRAGTSQPISVSRCNQTDRQTPLVERYMFTNEVS